MSGQPSGTNAGPTGVAGVGHRVWRSWPWTAALAAVLGGFVLLGMIGLSLRTSGLESLISMVITFAAVVALVRVLSSGVRATPSGLIIRELTRTVHVPWQRVRSVTCQPTERKRVYAPTLILMPERVAKGGRRGRAADETLQLRILGSYREEVAKRRADEIAECARTARAR
ncbi:MAG TPA: hypothetical protein VF163_22265 [Micromonosporaceae bacterium]